MTFQEARCPLVGGRLGWSLKNGKYILDINLSICLHNILTVGGQCASIEDLEHMAFQSQLKRTVSHDKGTNIPEEVRLILPREDGTTIDISKHFKARKSPHTNHSHFVSQPFLWVFNIVLSPVKNSALMTTLLDLWDVVGTSRLGYVQAI